MDVTIWFVEQELEQVGPMTWCEIIGVPPLTSCEVVSYAVQQSALKALEDPVGWGPLQAVRETVSVADLAVIDLAHDGTAGRLPLVSWDDLAHGRLTSVDALKMRRAYDEWCREERRKYNERCRRHDEGQDGFDPNDEVPF